MRILGLHQASSLFSSRNEYVKKLLDELGYDQAARC